MHALWLSSAVRFFKWEHPTGPVFFDLVTGLFVNWVLAHAENECT